MTQSAHYEITTSMGCVSQTHSETQTGTLLRQLASAQYSVWQCLLCETGYPTQSQLDSTLSVVSWIWIQT